MLMYKEKGHVLYWNTIFGKQQLNYKSVFGKVLWGGRPLHHRGLIVQFTQNAITNKKK